MAIADTTGMEMFAQAGLWLPACHTAVVSEELQYQEGFDGIPKNPSHKRLAEYIVGISKRW
jgi:hypothetical protein